MNKLEILFEKYNFDYIYLNPKDFEYLEWEIVPEEMFVDCKTPPDYVGRITIKDSDIEVYYDKKITPGDVIFKYKTLKKERNVKLSNIQKS